MARPKMCKRIFRVPKIICFKPDVEVDYQKTRIHRNNHGRI